MRSRTGIYVRSGNGVPEYYLGGQSCLYSVDGALFATGDWRYGRDSDLVTWYEFGGEATSYTSGLYYSKGKVRLYNGNGYTTFECNATPFLMLNMPKRQSNFEINSNGETYGSNYYMNGDEVGPDLVFAKGVNGQKGYIRAEDLNRYEPTTLEEAMEYMNSLEEVREIPVYESDGSTVIDKFIISNIEENYLIQ